jgi:hypothetical protein
MRSDIYRSKSGVTGFVRPQATSVIYPAWRKGDRVLHRPSGFYGELTEPATACARLWKMRIIGSHVDAVKVPAAFPKGVTVHAGDLELSV